MSFEETLASLEAELALGKSRARFTAGKLAMSVREDRVRPRDYLNDLLDSLSQDDELAGPTGARLVLILDIEEALIGRQGHRRPSHTRWVEARHRMNRADAGIGVAASDRWRFRMREALLRSVLPGKREEAIKDLRSGLLDAGYPEKRNFVLSLWAVNLVTQLKMIDDGDSIEEAHSIVQDEASWRTDRYGESHPFTLVAEANRLLIDLTNLELRHDTNALAGGDRRRALSLIEDLRDFRRRRVSIMGEKHGGSVLALSYEARAFRIAGDSEAAGATAETAIVRRGQDPETLIDDALLAILRIVLADSLSARRQVACEHGRAAEEAARRLAPYVPERSTALRTARMERDRAEGLRVQGEELLSKAQETLGHQNSHARWIDRATRIRRRLAE